MRPRELTARLRALDVGLPRLIDEGLAELALLAEGSTGPEERNRLRGAARKEVAHRLVATSEASEVLALLHREGVRVAVWKGLAIATLWPEGARPLGDLDLLVEPAQLDEARLGLESAGYRRAPEAVAGRIRRGPTGVELLPAPGRVLAVDLHARPFRSVGHRIEAGSLLARARPATLAGAPVLALDPVDHAHLVCVHAAKHAMALLRWELDVLLCAEALSAEAWLTLEDRVAEARTAPALALALRAAGHPAHRRFAPGLGAPLLDRVARRARATGHPESLPRADRYALELLLEPGLRARARMLAGLVERLAG